MKKIPLDYTMVGLKEETINVLETLINTYHSVDQDGELTAPIMDIVEAWMNAKELLSKLKDI
jgi:hypothetical protein